MFSNRRQHYILIHQVGDINLLDTSLQLIII